MLMFTVVLASVLCLVSCESHCDAQKTCGECIGHSYKCLWCPAVNHKGSRCQTDDFYAKNTGWCGEKVYNPEVKDDIKVTRNDPLSSGGNGKPAVQITPQIVIVTARPGKTVNFTASYRPAEDYPLDVYYVMDNSHTMQGTLKVLRQQAQNIYKSLTNYTSNLRIGIGTFVEKKALPYASYPQEAYAFRNDLSLTNDTYKFMKALDLKTGANLDDPESGLDALMQAMVCDQLGWRAGSRKIIVLCTDNTYHSAGDGKMAGAAKLNDMRCHLTSDPYLGLEQDYPTVNQINKIAKEQNMVIIFSVVERFEKEYQALARKIKGASYVELMAEGERIVKTITKVYSDALRYLQITIDSHTDKVSVSLYPDCTKDDQPENCGVTPAKKTLSLNISITPQICINEKDGYAILNPVGLGEKLAVQVKTLCNCECEKYEVPNAPECSGQGTLQCGICRCNENRTGDKCECTGESSVLTAERCRAKPGEDVFSGRGTCNSCGICSCESGFSGALCQFDDNGCARAGGLLCGGRGRCHEGACRDCQPGWVGDACQCPTDTTECLTPLTEDICSGNGECVCGKCVCTKIDSKNNKYTGAFCESCSDCDEQQCSALEKYAKCIHFKTNETCQGVNTEDVIVTLVNRTEFNDPAYHWASRCDSHQEDDRSLLFRHTYTGRKVELIIQIELEEPDRANFFIAMGSSFGAVLLLGLLALIVWKAGTDCHDRHEYERFSEQLNQPVDPANVNALYRPPTAAFNNPTYRKSRLSRLI